MNGDKASPRNQPFSGSTPKTGETPIPSQFTFPESETASRHALPPLESISLWRIRVPALEPKVRVQDKRGIEIRRSAAWTKTRRLCGVNVGARAIEPIGSLRA
jgi:hypothetical protein